MGLENHKPTVVMVACQFMYAGAGVNLGGRVVLLEGLSSAVFVVYRQLITFLFIAPLAFFLRRGNLKECRLGWRSFWMIFLLSLVGPTFNQNLYAEGLYLSSSTATSALGNFIPAITFLMAYTLGLEKVELQSLRIMAKVIGTVVCVSGAVGMNLFKGPKLLNMYPITRDSSSTVLGSKNDTWLLGCLCVVGDTVCWSLWLILQVMNLGSDSFFFDTPSLNSELHIGPSKCLLPGSSLLTAWMCLMSVVQSGAWAFIVEPGPSSWVLDSTLQIMCCLYVTWSIAERGPVFCAMFNPLNMVIVAMIASVFMHEELYIGSIVLWGKVKDHQANEEQSDNRKENRTDETSMFSDCKIDLEEPLLPV